MQKTYKIKCCTLYDTGLIYSIRFVWTGSFKLLVVQHKPGVTKLWGFTFGIWNRENTSGYQGSCCSVTRRSLLLWQSLQTLGAVLARGVWLGAAGSGEQAAPAAQCKPLFQQERYKNCSWGDLESGLVLYFLNGNYFLLIVCQVSDLIQSICITRWI